MQVVASPPGAAERLGSGVTPWHFEGANRHVRETLELRMRLLPYLYSAFATYHFNAGRFGDAFEDARWNADDQLCSVVHPVAPSTERGVARVLLPDRPVVDSTPGAFLGGPLSYRPPGASAPRAEGAVIRAEGAVANTTERRQALEVPPLGTRPGAFDLFEDDGRRSTMSGRYRIRRRRLSRCHGLHP